MGCPFVFGRYDTELGVSRPVFQIELCARVIRAINSMIPTPINFYFAHYVLKPTTTTHFFHWTSFVIFRLVNLNTTLPIFKDGHPPSPSEVLGARLHVFPAGTSLTHGHCVCSMSALRTYHVRKNSAACFHNFNFASYLVYAQAYCVATVHTCFFVGYEWLACNF